MPKESRDPAESGRIAVRAAKYSHAQLAFALLDLLGDQNRYEIQDMSGISIARALELEVMRDTMLGKFG
jgi:hypothetical protein